jgi:hypothetical protein
MEIRIITDSITIDEVKELAKLWYGEMIKGVVDIERDIIALGGEFHRDANDVLIENGSKQSDVWGFNVWLSKSKKDWLEYNSLINIRPAQNNRLMDIEDDVLRDKMRVIIERIIKR